MPIDVLLIDDQVTEGSNLRDDWGPAGVRVIQSIGLADFQKYAAGERPAKWPEDEIDFKLVVVDLDLGTSSNGFAGGVIAVDAVMQWVANRGKEMLPIVLRTQDIDSRRSMGAILAAELLGKPLPWWGKNPEDAERLLGFLQATLKEDRRRVRPLDYGAKLIQPVLLSTGARVTRVPLGAQLFSQDRFKVWPRLGTMADQDAAVVYGGKPDSNKFFDESLKWAIAVLHQLRREGVPLHELDGEVVLVDTIVEDIYRQRHNELSAAMRDLATGLDEVPEERRPTFFASLRKKRQRVRKRLVDDYGAPPPHQWDSDDRAKASHPQSMDQGRFIGAYEEVVCDPEVNEIFGRTYVHRPQD